MANTRIIQINNVPQILILFFLIGSSCSPKILFFKANPCTTVTAADSVKFTWKVKHGQPVLLFSQEDGNDDENPGKHHLYYKLVARNGNKEVSYPTVAITVLKDTSTNYIFINTIRHGDSAVAITTLDTLQWGYHFKLHGVASASKRNVTVYHLERKTELDSAALLSAAFNGLPNSGQWYISTALTAAEKKDSSLIPGRLMLKTTIIHQK